MLSTALGKKGWSSSGLAKNSSSADLEAHHKENWCWQHGAFLVSYAMLWQTLAASFPGMGCYGFCLGVVKLWKV